MVRSVVRIVLGGALTALAASAASAQSLGAFSWQLAPFCNVITVNVTQTGATYTLDGYDTQCGGASNRAPVTGIAVPNPNGSIGLGLMIVTSPNATPVHVDTAINLASLGGTWRDSLGNTGSFVFTPAGVASGSPRPLATSSVPDGSITTPKLADGAVNASKIDPTAVQRRVQGACPAGQLMTGVTEGGSVTCEAVTSGSGGDITGVAAGTGLTGGGSTGDVTVSANFSQVQARVSSACPANETIRSIGADGTVVCDIDNDSGGDITAVIAGTGLSGGATVGDATLSVSYGGSGTTNAAARSNHTHAVSGLYNMSIGENALTGAGASYGITAIGFRALQNNTDGQGTANTAVGSYGLSTNTTGVANTAVGTFALRNNVVGAENTAVGAFALQDTTAALRTTAVGSYALGHHTFGADNTAVGSRAAYGGGSQNTAVGSNALSVDASTSRNTGVGASALSVATGNGNTAIGSSALDELVTGAGNIALGDGAGGQLTTGSDNLYLNHPGFSTEDSTIRIGRAVHNRAFLAGVRGVTTGANNAQTVVIDSSGQLGTVSSSRRTKFDIAELASPVTAALQTLRPVQFRYRQAFADGSTPMQYGLIAEEVQDVLPELVATDNEGNPASVKYHVLPALLLADVQRLERERVALLGTVTRQDGELLELRAEVATLRALIEAVTTGGSRR